MAGKPIDLTEVHITTRLGRRFLGALRASAPISGDDGSRYVDGIIEDVTERHEFEAALRQARDAAETASRAKTAFLANTSHEIRTPLNAILGYAQILRADRTLSQDQRRAVETVERSGNHLLALINDILDISKIEAGYQELSPEDFTLGELVEDLATMVELRCRQKRLDWRVRADLGDTAVHGDQNKLRQVLINLLGNAVKFCQEGHVELRVARTGGDTFEVVVSDTGPGIATDRQEAIFEPFQQADEGLNRRYTGAGLGLTLAAELARAMGGDLEAESSVGAGTCVTATVVFAAA